MQRSTVTSSARFLFTPALLLGGFAGSAVAQSPAVPVPSVSVSRSINLGSGVPQELIDRLRLGQGGLALPGPIDEPIVKDAEDGEGEAPVDPQRMQAFQQAMFDRRPSVIFAEWAKPEPLGLDEDPELALPEAPTAPEGEAPTAPEAPTPPAEPEGEAPTDPEALAQFEAERAEAQAAFEAAQAEYEPLKVEYDEQQKAWDEAQAAFQKAQSEFQQEEAQIKAKRQARELELYRRNVTLGRWDRLPELLDTFGEDGSKQMYTQLLQKLRQPQVQVSNSQLRPFAELNAFEYEDVLAIIAIAPEGFDGKQASMVVPFVRRAMALGHGFDEWLELLRAEIQKPEEERRVDRRLAALLMTALGRNEEMGEFLPTLEEAIEANDRQGMNLIARHHLARYRKDDFASDLTTTWDATMAALAPGEVEDGDKVEALKRAVDLASTVRDERGSAWLDESFTARPERGMEILATIGGDASKGMVQQAYQPNDRLETLELLSTSIGALLAAAPERAEEWRDTLNLLADVWLREAAHSYTYSQTDRRGGYQQRDAYGNVYWVNYGGGYRSSPVRPLEPGDLLEVRPDGRWRELLDASLRPKIDQSIAELYLKVGEEKEAFPYIESLAGPNLDKANELAREFLNVWIRNNDPNSSRNRSNIYNFSYGFNTRAAGIPLTRSKQERNLRDLAEWVERLRSVPDLELDSGLLVRAFTASHSQAEVYRIEVMEEVFGDLEELDDTTLANMAQGMRGNLATLWRQPAVQRNAGTNRKKKDIEAEVQRGYALAEELLGRALEAHPESWRLAVARAAMAHDLNNYRNELQKSSDFAERRREALAMFQDAAERYVATLPDLREREWTTEAFEYWFRAALGASDIPAIDQSTILAKHEIPKIAAALEGLSGERGERHRSMFANSLFTYLSGVNPAVKNRFLDAGFQIVGDHPQAKAAREVYDYYADLVTEIRVEAVVDGDTDVGTEPFGLRIDLRYTKEIERESGGFAKYLQNQANAVNTYYYNGGRPPENYRDKFEESLRTILGEQFEVMSLTFNKESAASKADDDYGWRRMSYAYVLMKARGPQVDRIPPIKLDLDFNDVTGYVVLPISSPVVAIDATRSGAVPPYENLQVTQILDEREAEEGRLSLEIKAQSDGLVPELDTILELAPVDFAIDDVIDQGVSVARFSDDEESVLTERIWTVALSPKEDVKEPETFAFAAPVDAGTQVLYQRYDDADLMKTERIVSLVGGYSAPSRARWWWIAAPLGIVLLLALLARIFRGAPREVHVEQLELPGVITPFSVLAFLRRARTSPRLGESSRDELDRTLGRIERHYFGERSDGELDLVGIAREWHGKAV